jgi:hypothetical protein
VGWRSMALDRDRWRAPANAVTNLLVARNSGNFVTSCERGNFSRRPLFCGCSLVRCSPVRCTSVSLYI